MDHFFSSTIAWETIFKIYNTKIINSKLNMYKNTKIFKSVFLNSQAKNYLNIKPSKYMIRNALRKHIKYVLILHFNQKNRCQKLPQNRFLRLVQGKGTETSRTSPYTKF